MLGSGDGGNIIKLRGLPFSTTLEDVLDFLSGVNVLNGKEGNSFYVTIKTWLPIMFATTLLLGNGLIIEIVSLITFILDFSYHQVFQHL